MGNREDSTSHQHRPYERSQLPRKAYTKDRAKHNPTNPKAWPSHRPADERVLKWRPCRQVPADFEVVNVKRNENKKTWEAHLLIFRQRESLCSSQEYACRRGDLLAREELPEPWQSGTS